MKPVASLVARNLAWLSAGEVVLKGALFGAGVLVARGLGPAAMGDFTVSYGAALALTLLLAAGQIEVIIREVARRPAATGALYRAARAWQGRIALVALPLAAVGALLVRVPSLRWTLAAFVPYAWLRCRLITGGAVFKGLDRMEVEVSGRGAEVLLALVLLVPLALLGAPVWATGLAFTVGAGAGVMVIGAQLRRLGDARAGEIPASVLGREGLGFFGLALTSQVLTRVDTFLLASLGIAREAIGRYGVASAPVWGSLALAQLLALAIYPTLARAAGRGTLRWPRVIALGGSGVALGLVIATALVLVRGPLVRLVFGSAYLDAAPLLGVLAWALPGSCAGMMVGAVLASCGRQGWGLISRVVVLLAAVVGNLVAIPRWGPMGAAAVAVAVSYVGMLSAIGLAALAAAHPRNLAGSALVETAWE